MTEAVESCAFPPCEQPAALTLRMVVEGEDLVLPVCHAHAKWMEGFADQDHATRVVDRVPVEDSRQPDGAGAGSVIAGPSEPPEHELGGEVGGVRSD